MEEARWCPPERASPSPRRSTSDKRKPSANWCRVPCLTRLARTRDKSPSGRRTQALVQQAGDGQVETEWPKNSRRSLWSALKLRCVTARCSSAGLANVCCKRVLQRASGRQAELRTYFVCV